MTQEQYDSIIKRKRVVTPPAPKGDAPDRWPLVLRDQIVEAGLPEPVREYTFHPTRNWRLDLAWIGPAMAVEVDGSVHRTKQRFAADIEKHNQLMLLDWAYIRVTPEMVRSGEALRWVKDFLEA